MAADIKQPNRSEAGAARGDEGETEPNGPIDSKPFYRLLALAESSMREELVLLSGRAHEFP